MKQTQLHSGQGITSIALGALAMLVILLNVTLWLIFHANNLLSSFNYVLTILVVLNMMIIITGMVNGIKGLRQKGHKKTLPAIGLSLNSFVLLLYIVGIILVLIRKI